ncbi:MAG: hypothetical protein H6620_07610 [Halobacteriovoraceae bacterium]|nr:hypothetical protein [Halobacteriovoraceae bacterium]
MTKRTNIKRVTPGPKAKKGSRIFSFLLSKKVFPFIVLSLLLGGVFVYTRMKSIEVQYSLNIENNKLKQVEEENKILKAKRAELLSPKRLRKLSSEFKLQAPTDKQIIVIP